MNKKVIYLASDHAGFEYKNKVSNILKNNFSDYFDVIDCGAETYDVTDDYPDFISLAADKVSKDSENSLAIIFGGSGQGEAMVANRYSKVRAIVYYGGDLDILKLSKQHNNANILSIGTRFVKEYDLENILNIWLKSDFSWEKRHIRRIEKIEKVQKKKLSSLLKNFKKFLWIK
jgi:ribose 5-phosphate isomerase B